MAADFSRVRLDPLLDYAGVELKQGGVLLDADANELVAILDRRLRALASDTLGRATVSATTPDAFKVSAADGDLLIGKGRMYVDGLLAENHGDASIDPAKRAFDGLMAEATFSGLVAYSQQPQLLAPAALPEAGQYLVYLDVWNREVTHLEQPGLVESAVGVETSSRLQTVWQVRLHQWKGEGDLACATPDVDIPGWSKLVAPSTGVLTTDTFDAADAKNPCELPPTGGYRGLENQLYRVEIHDPGPPGTATFKWSRENASVGSRVASMVSETELELDTLGRDDVLRIRSGDWVEICSDMREFSQAAGEMRLVTVDEATRRITFKDKLPKDVLPKGQNLRVRRWDQRGAVFCTDPGGTPVQVQDLDAASSTGVIKIPDGDVTLLLEHGITVKFASTGAKGFKAGDHWEFAARTATASVEALDRAPPRGIHHHYARLGVWDAAAKKVNDCRHPWPPAGGALTECGCTLCVTPDSHNGKTFTIEQAVNLLLRTGGTICLCAGQYVLENPVQITGARSLRITGQGPATVIVATARAGAAFIIGHSAAIAIDELSVVWLGQQSAICLRTVLGLALRKLALVAVGSADSSAPAISLSGAVLGATIDNNLIVATDGVCALEPGTADTPDMLLAAMLCIDNNVFMCKRSAVRLAGMVVHAWQTRMSGNRVAGSHDVGLSSEGFALPGTSMRFSDNDLDVHGAGIRCAPGGAWIDSNKLRATQDGASTSRGVGIELVTDPDTTTSRDGSQVLANQLSGFPEAGIRITAPVRELIVKLNVIEGCGNGIQVADSAPAAQVAIENNQLRGSGLEMAVGIAIAGTETATVAGNTVVPFGGDAGGAPAGGVRQALVVQGAAVSVLGNAFTARGEAPVVDVSASAEVLFNSNRCELLADVPNPGLTAVLLTTPIAIVHANRVRGGSQASIRVAYDGAAVTAVGNITTGAIDAPLSDAMKPLNLIV